jgi:LPS-assembly protein
MHGATASCLLSVALAAGARAGEWPAEVRVLSGPGAASTLIVRALPDVAIEDRTPGAMPTTGRRGVASSGVTFTGDVTLFLRGHTAPRPASIDVADPVVSTVRLFPEPGGTTVTVFVRQPVVYAVTRPSAIGEVRIELRGRTRQFVAGEEAGPARTDEVREVAIDAETLSYDRQVNTLTARGGVTVTHGDTTLTADEVIYDRTHGTLEASGTVVLTDPEAQLEGDFVHLHVDDESGWVEQGTVQLRAGSYIVTGGRLEKHGGPRYSVADGIFTTCRCGGLERPSWSIAGRETDVTLQGAGVVRGMTLRVKDVPVLYVPYLVFPANTERQSGFLFPRFGVSNARGFQYEQPFYWAIDKSRDATVVLDVETSARIGLVAEYRYVLSRRTHGQFTAAYYNEEIGGAPIGTPADPEPPDVPVNRWAIAGRHTQSTQRDTTLYLDAFAVSDDQFLRDINNITFSDDSQRDLALRTTRYTTTRGGVARTWRAGWADLEGAYYQDLIDPQEFALQTLPRIEAEHSVPLFDGRLVGRLVGQGVFYDRIDGYDGLRGDVAPELFLPFHLGRALHGSVMGRVHGTGYHLFDQEQVAFVVTDPATGAGEFRTAPELGRLDANRAQGVAEVRARLGTEIQRVFDFPHLGLEKLKHTIEPEVQYLYVPAVGRPIVDLPACPAVPGVTFTNCNPGGELFSEGYLFDEIDAYNRRNFVSYGLTTRLLGRRPAPAEPSEPPPEAAVPEALQPNVLAPGVSAAVLPPLPEEGEGAAAAPRELLRLSILKGYDVTRPLVADSHLSDIDFGLRVSPLDFVGLTYNTTVNFGQSTVRGLRVGAVLREPWWRPPRLLQALQTATSLSVAYRFVEDDVNEDAAGADAIPFGTEGVSELGGGLYLRLGDYMGFTFLSRYSFKDAPVVDDQGRATGELLGPHFLERDYFLRLISRCNCWLLEAGIRDTFNPDDRLFQVQFTLVGLGSVGSGLGGGNFADLAPLRQLGLGRPPGSRSP